MGSGRFWLKAAEHSARRGEGGCACRPPILKRANALRAFKENALKPNAASHTNSRRPPDQDGFLGLPPSGGSLFYRRPALQKIIPDFGGSPPHISVVFIYLARLLHMPYLHIRENAFSTEGDKKAC